VFVEQEVKKPQKQIQQKQVKTKLEIESITSQLEAVELTNKKIDDKRSTQVDERTKKVRKLKKSLRQIEELEEKLKIDKNFKIEKEQLDKMSRKNDFIAELLDLGEDEN
jgi:hypothetical protein